MRSHVREEAYAAAALAAEASQGSLPALRQALSVAGSQAHQGLPEMPREETVKPKTTKEIPTKKSRLPSKTLFDPDVFNRVGPHYAYFLEKDLVDSGVIERDLEIIRDV